MRLTFLGTSAARPTVERNVSSLALQREGETFLFDCGEGTQRQMMRYGVSFALSEIFFTHFHADHFLGMIGLVRTLGLQGREEPLKLYGPRGAKQVLNNALLLGVERVPFAVEIHEVKAGRPSGSGTATRSARSRRNMERARSATRWSKRSDTEDSIPRRRGLSGSRKAHCGGNCSVVKR